jgi:hypothetical protein
VRSVEEIRDDVINRMARLMKGDRMRAETWYHTSERTPSGRTPRWLLENGRANEVVSLVKGAEFGAKCARIGVMAIPVALLAFSAFLIALLLD